MTNAQKVRADAVTIVRGNLGLLDTPPAEWTYEQRVEYNKALASYINSHSTIFTPEDRESAQAVAARPYEPLATLGLGDKADIFTDEFLAQGKEVLSSSGNALKNALYIAVTVAVFLYVFPYAYREFQKVNTKP